MGATGAARGGTGEQACTPRAAPATPRKASVAKLLHIEGRKHRFGTGQGRLPRELRLAGKASIGQANQFLRERYLAELNANFRLA